MLSSIKNIFKKSDDTVKDANAKTASDKQSDDAVVLKAANDNNGSNTVVVKKKNDDEDSKSGAGFFGGMKNKMLVTMLRSQLSKMPLPPEQKKMFEKILDHKPELLFTIAQEIQTEMSKGKGQMQAAQSVMLKYQKELKDVVQG
jgi:hypothetical protein